MIFDIANKATVNGYKVAIRRRFSVANRSEHTQIHQVTGILVFLLAYDVYQPSRYEHVIDHFLNAQRVADVAEVLFMKSGSEESDRGARADGHLLMSLGEEVTAIIRK